MEIGFLTEPEPPHGVALSVRPGIARVVAGNAGTMTCHGTNSWVLNSQDGLIVIDPGPEEPEHLAVLAGLGKVTHILLTHTHADHTGGAPQLAMMTGASVHGWHAPPCAPGAPHFRPDVPLRDGSHIGPLTALHTPGHAPDHVCFALADGTVFTGDHVMGWSTSVVIPPDGRMADYLHSLRRLLARVDTLFLPGHGPPVPEPAPLLRALLAHRLLREAAIRRALGASPRTVPALVSALYPGLSGRLAGAAALTMEAHLIKLSEEGHAGRQEEGWVKESRPN